MYFSKHKEIIYLLLNATKNILNNVAAYSRYISVPNTKIINILLIWSIFD